MKTGVLPSHPSQRCVKKDLVSFEEATGKTEASFTTAASPLFPRPPWHIPGRAPERYLYVKEGGGGGINTSNFARYRKNFFHKLM
jgi:hypothetical protein